MPAAEPAADRDITLHKGRSLCHSPPGQLADVLRQSLLVEAGDLSPRRLERLGVEEGEGAAPLDKGGGPVSERPVSNEVDFRYGGTCLMMFMDGHITSVGPWQDLGDLETNNRINISRIFSSTPGFPGDPMTIG